MTTILKHRHIETRVFLAMALFATVLLFIISPDSYTHDLYARHDSAWFFMCGKAWMEGMRPYVDFTDSKGPLLWLIYGIGYLLSPRNYIGVFWLSCVWYAAIFYITYLTAKVFLHDRHRSVVCAVLMALAFFNPAIHHETKAEEWSTLFLMLSMYYAVRILYSTHIDARNIRTAFFVLGVSFAALVLIKYNLAAMQVIFILYAFWHVLRHQHTALMPLLFLVAGSLVLFTPFVAYLIHQGCFEAFIQEYFVNSFLTTSTSRGVLSDYLTEWRELLFSNLPQLLLFVMLVSGSILYAFKTSRYRLFPLVSTLFIFAITLRHARWNYYFNILAPCHIWIFLCCIQQVKGSFQWRTKTVRAIAAAVVILLTVCTVITNEIKFHHMFWDDGPRRAYFYNTEYYISQVESPRIINAYYHEDGHGILSKSLPASKYWSMQNGLTKEMYLKHLEGIFSKNADFIIFNSENRIRVDNWMSGARLRSAGYPYCYNHCVYSKKPLKKPARPIHVTNWEVLTKQIPKALRGVKAIP